VDERVLPWKIESIGTHSAYSKDLAVVMKPPNGVIYEFETARIEDVTSSCVAKFKKGAHCLHHFVWYVAYDRWQVNL
jgi:hypothetical protein